MVYLIHASMRTGDETSFYKHWQYAIQAIRQGAVGAVYGRQLRCKQCSGHLLLCVEISTENGSNVVAKRVCRIDHRNANQSIVIGIFHGRHHFALVLLKERHQRIVLTQSGDDIHSFFYSVLSTIFHTGQLGSIVVVVTAIQNCLYSQFYSLNNVLFRSLGYARDDKGGQLQ